VEGPLDVGTPLAGEGRNSRDESTDGEGLVGACIGCSDIVFLN
jgi:hypothetical protein